MKKKIVSLVVALAMIVCLAPGVAGVAKASYDCVDLKCYANGSGVTIKNVAVTDYTYKGLRRDNASTVAADFKAINDNTARSGYIFLGWYTAKSGGTKLTANNVESIYAAKFKDKNQTGTMEIYAHWVKKQSTITATCNKRIVNVVLGSSGGHNWSVYDMSPMASWLTIEKLTNYDSFRFTIAERTDSVYSARGTTVRFRDNYGNIVAVTVSQAPNYENVRARVNGTFAPKRFYNECAANTSSVYNMGYAALFRNGNSGGTWCTDSAVMDLLNRRLAADGLLSTNRFFDIRDIMPAMTSTSIGQTNANKQALKQTTVSRLSNIDDIRSNVYTAFSNKASNDESYELCNNNSGEYPSTFENIYGKCTNSSKKYTVVFEGVLGLSKAKKIEKITSLLNTRPEGVFVYANYEVSGKKSQHAMLIVGYTKSGNNYTFKYVDNSGNTGVVDFDGTHFSKDLGLSWDTVLGGIRNIGYIK